MEAAPTNSASFSPGTGEQPGNGRKNKLNRLIRKKIDEYLATVDSPQLLNEISYTAYTRMVTENSPKQKMTNSVKLLTRKLNEIDQLLTHSTRLKETMGSESWQLSEQNKEYLKTRIKRLYQEIKKL